MTKNTDDAFDKPIPTNTTSQMRTPMFAPLSRSPRANDEVRFFENVYGTLAVRGSQLTQDHRNIIDVIFTHFTPVHEDESGAVEFEFTLYELQKHLNKKSLYNHEWIKAKLDQMQRVQMQLKMTNGLDTLTFSILNDHADSLRGSQGQTGHPLYNVQFNRHYINFIERDMAVHTEKLTHLLIELDNPQAQAVVRYCLSHQYVNHRLTTIYEHLGISESRLARSTVHRYLAVMKDHKAYLEKHFDIILDYTGTKLDPLVKYSKSKRELVWFENEIGEEGEAVDYDEDTRTPDLFD